MCKFEYGRISGEVRRRMDKPESSLVELGTPDLKFFCRLPSLRLLCSAPSFALRCCAQRCPIIGRKQMKKGGLGEMTEKAGD